MAIQLPELTVFQKRWLGRLGYPAAGLFTFLFAVYYTFPYGRLKDRLVDSLSGQYDVAIDSVRPGIIPGHLIVKGITLKTRPLLEEEKPTVFSAEEVDLNIGLFAMMGGHVDVKFEASVGGGKVTGEYAQGSAATTISVHSSGLPLETIPGAKSATGGVPIVGPMDADFSVTLPKGKWHDATGSVEIACDGCTIGDGVAKIRPMAPGQQNAFANEGFTLPKIKLGKIGGKLEIKKGVGTFVEFGSKSPDGEMHLEGEIHFDDPFARTQVTAYMTYKMSDALKARESRLGDMDQMQAAVAKRPDGFNGVRITGPIGQLRFQSSKTSPLPTKGPAATTAGTKPPIRAVGGGPMPPAPVGTPAGVPPPGVRPPGSPEGAPPPGTPPAPGAVIDGAQIMPMGMQGAAVRPAGSTGSGGAEGENFRVEPPPQQPEGQMQPQPAPEMPPPPPPPSEAEMPVQQPPPPEQPAQPPPAREY